MRRTPDNSYPRVSSVIGRNFRRLRKAADQTQSDASAHFAQYGMYWPQPAISNIERGNRENWTLEELATVCVAYSVTMEELFDVGPDPMKGICQLTPDLKIHTNSLMHLVNGGVVHDEDLIDDVTEWYQNNVAEKRA